MNYKDYNDNELVNYIYENSEEATEILYEKYKPLIVNMSTKMIKYCGNLGLEVSDLIQEGMLGLNNAVNHYNENKNISFYTFAKTCIERQMISQIRSAKRLKHRILNESLSFEIDDSNEEVGLEYFFGDDEYNPENIVLGIEQNKDLLNDINQVLTPFEQQVFELKMSEFEYKEIAEILDKEPKSIDNAIQRIKIKIKKILDEKK